MPLSLLDFASSVAVPLKCSWTLQPFFACILISWIFVLLAYHIFTHLLLFWGCEIKVNPIRQMIQLFELVQNNRLSSIGDITPEVAIFQTLPFLLSPNKLFFSLIAEHNLSVFPLISIPLRLVIISSLLTYSPKNKNCYSSTWLLHLLLSFIMSLT